MLDLPSTLADFVAGLEARQFERTDERYEPQAFGNGLIELTEPSGRRLRLVRDKGLWGIDVHLESDWRDVYKTALVLTDSPYQQRALSHEDLLRYALKVLELMPIDPVDQTRLNQRVAALQRRVWEDRYGPPPGPVRDD
jgi:hypothetical protein